MGRKYFNTYTSHKIIQRIYKEFFQLNNKNPNNSIFIIPIGMINKYMERCLKSLLTREIHI